MDSRFVYTALRSITPGHVPQEEYTMRVFLAESSIPRRSIVKTESRSVGGNMEVLLDRADVEWDLDFAPLNGEELMLLVEFLDSVEGGENFDAYLYGTESEAKRMRRTDDGYSLVPFMRIGSEEGDYFQITGVRALVVP